MFVKDENFPLLAVEKLLVHLTEYPELKALELHPHAMTQDGISEAIGVSRPHVARELKKLQAQGLVDSKMAHVAGLNDRRRAYFLTDQGREGAVLIHKVCNELTFEVPVVNAYSVEQFRFGGGASGSDVSEGGPRPNAPPR